GEILDGAKTMRMQCRHKGEDRHRQGEDLANDRECSCGAASGLSDNQNQKCRDHGRRRNQPNVARDPGVHPLRRSSWSTLVVRKWRYTAITMARPTAASAAAMAMAKIATITPVNCTDWSANLQNAMKLIFAAASII